MTNSSTNPANLEIPTEQESQKDQINLDSFPEIIEALLNGVKLLPVWSQLGAFFLVIGLVATAITTWSLESDNHKLSLGITFLLGLASFVLVLYALNAHQIKSTSAAENLAKQAKEAELSRLNEEVGRKILYFNNMERSLKDIAARIATMHAGDDKDYLLEQIGNLEKLVHEGLHGVSQYQKELLSADRLEAMAEKEWDPSIFN